MNLIMVLLSFSIFLGIILSALAPILYRWVKRHLSILLAIYPIGVFTLLCLAIPEVAGGQQGSISLPWVPRLGLALNISLDGLGLVMALLITGIGALVIIYGGAYLHYHPFLNRFYGLVLLFMTSMLGLVLSANALLLFVFWELTSISSFFLIGFEHSKPNARAAAWQALLVTGSGGLAMLAGFALLANITGSFELNRWIELSNEIIKHPMAPAAFLLVLIGACTKSAQFPFHFWLPNAMEAPTPVSAYLHSATMVKAGIYLLARLFPVFSGLPLWTLLLTSIGLITFLGGSLLSLAQTDLKRLLAYTTVAALGLLTFLLGLANPLAIKTAMVVLVTHALYKGSLFLVAGSVDHGTGSRDITVLGAAGRAMPYTASAAGLAALSMAGFPPFMGFIAKELVYETTLSSSWLLGLTIMALIANVVTVVIAAWVGFFPFWGKPTRKDLHPHESSPGLWAPPLLLALLGIFLGIIPEWVGVLVAPAAQELLQESLRVKLSLWHGFTPMLGLSVFTLIIGIGLSVFQPRLQSFMAVFWRQLGKLGPAALYPRSLHAMNSFAAWQTRLLQSGYLRIYVLVVVVFTVGLAVLTYGLRPSNLMAFDWNWPRFYDVILIGIILIATFLVTRARSRLATIALLGSIGFSIALIYLLYSAPDLAMVQFAIETLTVIMFVLVLYRLPKFAQLSSRVVRTVDGVVAISSGLLMTLLVLLVSAHNSSEGLSRYFAENSLSQANGRNIVNVILVDFRGFDTLGEITVLAVAAMGVYSLIKLVISEKASRAGGGDP